MATVYFLAIIERGPEGFGVFPDLPGCVSAGTTIQEAALGAEEALSGHLAVIAEIGDLIATPSDIDAVEPVALGAEGAWRSHLEVLRGRVIGRTTTAICAELALAHAS